jgi:catechol 2,3-dioxygenase-like lactoylglutathione lyase family enzyme
MDLQPHHIGIVVADLPRSTSFYQTLGFEVVSDIPAQDGSRAIRFMRLGAFELELFWYAEPIGPEAAPSPAGKGRLGFRHFALRTADIDGTLSALKEARLVAPDLEVRVTPLGYRLVFLADPDGIEIEVMQEEESPHAG